MATKKGIVKKTPITDYANVRKTGLAAISLREDDELIEVKKTDNNQDVFLVTKYGQCIRFKETDVRKTGRTSMGVIGMNLTDGDEVIGMQMQSQGDALMIVSEKGLGKCTLISEFTTQNRGGKGVKTLQITEKTGKLIAIKSVTDANDLMIINRSGLTIRIPVGDIRLSGRATQGVKVINLRDGDSIASVIPVPKSDEEEPAGETGTTEEQAGTGESVSVDNASQDGSVSTQDNA